MSTAAFGVVSRLFRDGRQRFSSRPWPGSPGAGRQGFLRFLTRGALALALAVGTGSLVFLETDRAQAAETHYVALGDSYSSGVGAGDYATDDPGCKRSANAYSQRWMDMFLTDPVATFAFVACSGATTKDVESKQLSALSAETTMVSMTIGGNDVGFAPIVAECLVVDAVNEDLCLAAVLAAGVKVKNSMPATLDALYKKIKEAAPNARVFILGYPHIFQLGSCGMGLSEGSREAINEVTSALNTVIRDAATANGFTFVDGEEAFMGRGVCTTAPGGAWLTDSSAGTELYHPNRDGHEAYAVVLDAAVRGVNPIIQLQLLGLK